MRKEIQIHSRIRHPNIVQIMAVANTNQSVLIISEYIQGPNLEEVIFGEKKHILDGNKKNFAVQICRAVAYLHARNPQIIHQDIKPANILINLQSKIISKMKILGSSTSTCATTMPGAIMYMAPESILHRKSFAASDVWSLGCTLLEMFTESDTWDIPTGGDPLEFLTQIMRAGMKPPRSNHLDMPDISQCFAYDMNQRPSAKDLIKKFC